jgi:ATP-dependent exoDNAse (exonuclease V) beta subunit
VLADLHALAARDGAATVNELLIRSMQPDSDVALSDDGRARLRRTYPILRSALENRARHSLRDWVEKTWSALAGPATLTSSQDLEDAEAYFERLDKIEVAGDLLDLARLEEQLENLYARPRRSGKARVDVMTIHKAKGLEFDTVILPGLQRWMRAEDRELLRWSRVAGLPEGIVFAPVKAQGADADPIYRWIELLEKERAERERGRLLYVAATRAKRDLHLIGAVALKETPEGTEVQPPRSGSMLQMLWQRRSRRLPGPRSRGAPMRSPRSIPAWAWPSIGASGARCWGMAWAA